MDCSKIFKKLLIAVIFITSLFAVGCASIESKSYVDRREAFAKITEQKEFEEIALTGKYADMRSAAVKKLNRQEVIEKVAKSDRNSVVRGAAASRITNQNVLSDIAFNDSNHNVRVMAVNHLKEPGALARISLTDKDRDVRKAAENGLSNFSPGKGSWSKDELAVFYLKDPALIEKLARSAGTPAARIMAVDKILDPSLRSSIIINEKNSSARIKMLNRSKDQQLMKKLALDDPDPKVRLSAVLKLSEPDALSQVAIKEVHDDIRLAAVKKITDQKLLSRIAMEDKDSNIRETALSGISDKNEERNIRLKLARLEDTIAAYEKFIKRYPGSKETSGMRKELAKIKSRRLGELVLLMTPKPALKFSANPFVTGFGTKSHPAPMAFKGVSMERPSSYKRNLEEFRTLIKEGADPMAYRISGYKPQSQPTSGGFAIISMGGNSTKVVPASKGGMTLYKYCKENKIDEIVAILKKHSK